MNLRYPALASGLLFAATAAVDIPHAQHTEGFTGPLDYVLEVLFCLSLGAAATALWALSRSGPRRAARFAAMVPATGYTVLTLVTGATAVSGHDVLGPGFVLGLLLVLAGTLSLAVLDGMRRLDPRGVGLVLLVGAVAMAALGEGYGLIAWSAGWFAVAALARTAGSAQSAVTTTSTRWNSLSSV
jgi:hypothetical protein